MESLAPYYLLTLKLPQRTFVARHNELYLLKVPDRVDRPPDSSDDWTASTDAEPSITALKQDLGDFAERKAAAWGVAVVRRAEGAPDGAPVVLGRAAPSDVVLPFPSVSQRHAELALGLAGACTLRDLRSRFGTAVNGQRLQPGDRVPVRSSDAIRLGELELLLVDGLALYALLVAM